MEFLGQILRNVRALLPPRDPATHRRQLQRGWYYRTPADTDPDHVVVTLGYLRRWMIEFLKALREIRDELKELKAVNRALLAQQNEVHFKDYREADYADGQ